MTAAEISARASRKCKSRLLDRPFYVRIFAWLQRHSILQRDRIATGLEQK